MPVFAYKDKTPNIADDVYVSPQASIIGQATIGARSSIWEHAVIRADYNTVTIGTDSSIQDNCTVHCDLRFPTKIGNRVTLGHNSVAHGCIIDDNCLIGIGAIILNDAHIGERSIVGAGAVITPGTKIPAESLVVGIPGKVVRSLKPADLFELENSWKVYVELSREYLKRQKKTTKK
jgi:carbonic anhydrase/acetyltransferase-like protein (isoleucine patch superfamily)